MAYRPRMGFGSEILIQDDNPYEPAPLSLDLADDTPISADVSDDAGEALIRPIPGLRRDIDISALVPPMQKGAILYDNEQSFGAGSPVVGDDHDKIRWQSESLWPAYWTQDAVPNSKPEFVERPSAFLGQGVGIQYAGPKVHSLIFNKNEYNPETEFGEYNQLFDLFIDIEEFVKHYGSQYNITVEDFASQMNGRSGPLPSQILQFTDFLVALRDLYGLHIRPIVDLERDAGPPPIRADYESQNAFVIAFMNWSTRARAIRVDAEKSFTSGFFKRHKDHATEVPFLMTEEEAEYANLLYRPGIARINPVYNYLLLDYEKVLESKVKSSGVTHGIPNLYVLTREAMNDESVQAFIPGRPPQVREIQEDFKNFATVGGLIRGVRPRTRVHPIFGPGGNGGVYESTSYSSRQYFCSWTQAIDRILPFQFDFARQLPPGRQTTEQNAAIRFGNAITDFQYLIIPPEEMNFILTANDEREAYPMYNEIKFQMQGRKSYASLLHRLRLTNFFARHSITAPMSSFNTYTRTYTGQGPSTSPHWGSTNTVLDPQEFRTMDVLNFWRRFDDPDELTSLEQELKADPELALLGKNIEDRLFVAHPELLQPAIRYNFLEGIRRHIKRSLRSYSDMLVGKLAPSETIFYRIEKRLNDEVVQEFFVPNNGTDTFEYIDTQVMYGMSTDQDDYNRYDYTIYDARMVIGDDYRTSVWAKPQTKSNIPGDRWNFPLRPPRDEGQAFAPPIPYDVPEATDEDIRLVRFAGRGTHDFTYEDAMDAAQERRDEALSVLGDLSRAIGDTPLVTGTVLETIMGLISDDEGEAAPDAWMAALPDLLRAIDVDLAAPPPLPDAPRFPGAPRGGRPDPLGGEPWPEQAPLSPRDLIDDNLEVNDPLPAAPGTPPAQLRPVLPPGEAVFPDEDDVPVFQAEPLQRPSPDPAPSPSPLAGLDLLRIRGLIFGLLDDFSGPIEWLEDGANADSLDIQFGYYRPDGTEGRPQDMMRQNPQAGKFMVRLGMFANLKPSVKIIQVPIFSTRQGPGVYLYDKPPAPPEVEFVPYRAVDNQLLVNLNEQANTHVKAVPITFTEQERVNKDYVRLNQARQGHIPFPPGADWENVPMIFGNDDLPASFEVYRVDEPPNSYDDFIGNLYHIADLTDERGVPELSSASLKDALIPNQKYYYTFRVKDVHGHTSNPTDVYQLELVNNAGAVYLLLEMYNFPEENSINYTKSVQQYIQIKPSLLQEVVNEEKSHLISPDGEPVSSAAGHIVHLGPDGKTVWGRKLKFRFISKKTGRKIDVNVDVELNQDPWSDSRTPGPGQGDDPVC